MYQWQKLIQVIIDEIDACIQQHEDEALTLRHVSQILGYSTYHTTRKFKEISSMSFREYLRNRKLAFALKELRDGQDSILNIAIKYGFSSREAFSRAFKKTFGTTPSAFRRNPYPVILRTKVHPFDRYLLGLGEIGMMKSMNEVSTYFVTIPAHKFLHIRNYESNGYWDFWQKQNQIPGQDQETICGYLDSIKGKLDDEGGTESDSSSGQIMAYINDPAGRLCNWNFPRIESYGVRLPMDYQGTIPPNMIMMDVPEAEYLVFEHGPFDYEQENRSVEEKVEQAMATFDFTGTGYVYDTTQGRMIYFYHDPKRFWKYIRPVKKITSQ